MNRELHVQSNGVTSTQGFESLEFLKAYLVLEKIPYKVLGDDVIVLGNSDDSIRAYRVSHYDPQTQENPLFSTYFGEVIDRGRIKDGTFLSDGRAPMKFGSDIDRERLRKSLVLWKRKHMPQN